MFRSYLLVCCSMLTPASHVIAAEPASTTAVPAKAVQPLSDESVRSILRNFVEKGEVKGVVVGILDPTGRRRFFSSGTSGDGALPLSANSQFEIGSINKTMTAAVLSELVRRKKVSLNDPISRYLPSMVRVPSHGGKVITLQQLATHTSGLPRQPEGYVPPDENNPYAAFSEKHLYEFMNRYELTRDPGQSVEYSNLGAGLLSHVLARAAGSRDFKTLVESRLLKPLGMTSTRYARTRAMTKGHGEGGAVVPHWDVDILSGAGGLNSSAQDMLAYVDANVGPPRSPLEQAIRLAHIASVKDASTGRVTGLAWDIRERNGRTVLAHGGGTAGYSSFIAIDPAQSMGVVVLTNSGGFRGADDIAFAIMRGTSQSTSTVKAGTSEPVRPD